MANYKVTNIDQVSGEVTIEVLNKKGALIGREIFTADVSDAAHIEKLASDHAERFEDNQVSAVPTSIKDSIGVEKEPAKRVVIGKDLKGVK